MTYVDEHGASVYGQRIRHLGESSSSLFFALPRVADVLHRQRGIARGVLLAPCLLQTYSRIFLDELPHCNAVHLR